MERHFHLSYRTIVWLGLCALAIASGCTRIQQRRQYCPPPHMIAPTAEMPRELSKTTLPDYVIEPPDILLIDAVKVVPKPPYRIDTLDTLLIQVEGTLPNRPIEGSYTVEPGGVISFGPPYGSAKVLGMTIDEATIAVTEHLKSTLREPIVNLSLGETIRKQQIAGEHIVGPDGKITLGTYGKVYVTGMTQEQAKAAVETHLTQFLEKPEVSVDIFAYNSKVYYVVTQGAGLGDGVVRFPITGNETVLDAIAQINGLEAVSSKRIWVARPAPFGTGHDQVLPVDYCAIVQRADPATNYQVMPGDRLYIAENKLAAIDTAIARIVTPAYKVFGFCLMGNGTVTALQRKGGGANGIGFF